MLSGKVAATLGGFWNVEGLQLQTLHKRPLIVPVDHAGVPTYDELVLVVREDEARKRGQDLRAFLQALTRGQHEVRADPAAAAALVVKANPSLEAKLQTATIKRDAAGDRAQRSGQALRLAEPQGVGGVRQLDVLPPPARHTTRTPNCSRSRTSSCPVRASRAQDACASDC